MPDPWLFDCYPHPRRSALVVWIKHGRVTKRLVPYKPDFCIKAEHSSLEEAEAILAKDKRVEATWRSRSVLWLRGPEEPVLRVRPKSLHDLHAVATDLRRATRSKGYTFYDVDNQPESRWMHDMGLWSMCRLRVGDDGQPALEAAEDEDRFTNEYPTPDLRTVHLRVIVDAEGPTRDDAEFSDDLVAIQFGDRLLQVGTLGDEEEERELLIAFGRLLGQIDPDVIFTQHGDRFDIPYLLARIRRLGLHHTLWLGREPDPVVGSPDQKPKSIHTYGRWLFKTAAYYLRGRWHIDLSKKTLDSEDDRKDIHGILYLARVSNRRAQDVNRNGAGYALQQMQIDLAQDMGVAIPWKRNLVEDWKDAATLCAVDRGGQIMVPTPGIYEDVAACDFSGYYPSLIVEHNLSSDTINCTCCPDGEMVPELGYHLCHKNLGHQATVLARLNPHRKWAKGVLRRARHEPVLDTPRPGPLLSHSTNTSRDQYVSGDPGSPPLGQGQRSHVADPGGDRQHPPRRTGGRAPELGRDRPPHASKTGPAQHDPGQRGLPEAAGVPGGGEQRRIVGPQPESGVVGEQCTSRGPVVAGPLHDRHQGEPKAARDHPVHRHPQAVREADGLHDPLTRDKVEKARAIKSEHKALGVVCFGYFRYRNARFGCAEVHQSIQCYGRQGMTRAREVARSRGFQMVHAMTDCAFLQRPGITRSQALAVARAISREVGVVMDLEGIYRWVVFLPSKVHSHSAPGTVGVPNRYYGKFANGELKVRGIDVQKHSTPDWIRDVQWRMLHILQEADDADGFMALLPRALDAAKDAADRLRARSVDPRELGTVIQSTRAVEEYAAQTNTRTALLRLREAGTERKPGEYLKYVVTRQDGPKEGRVVPIELWDEKSPWFQDARIGYNAAHYLRLLARSVETLLAPFGHSEECLFEWFAGRADRPQPTASRRVDLPVKPEWVA